MEGKNEGLQTVSIRMPKELYRKLALIAKKETRSISQQINHYIKQALKEEEYPILKAAEPSINYKPPPEEGDAKQQANG